MKADKYKAKIMLPDYPEIKKEISQVFIEFLQMRIRQRMMPFDDIGKSIIHEGGNTMIVRSSGEKDEMEMKEASVEALFTEEELENMDLNEVLKRYDVIAEEMASQQSKHFYKVLTDTTKKSGNVVDAKGKPLSSEMLMGVLEKMHIDFKEDGSPAELKLVVGPGSEEKMKELMEEYENSPELKEKYDRLIQKKKEEYDAREASRILVG